MTTWPTGTTRRDDLDLSCLTSPDCIRLPLCPFSAAKKADVTDLEPAQFADAKHDSSHARHPGMHITDTIDYAILLHGELVAIMDEGETVMRAGDILIQRGTNHAWANRSGAVARIAFILVDGRR